MHFNLLLSMKGENVVSTAIGDVKFLILCTVYLSNILELNFGAIYPEIGPGWGNYAGIIFSTMQGFIIRCYANIL